MIVVVVSCYLTFILQHFVSMCISKAFLLIIYILSSFVCRESLNASHPLQEEIVEDLRATFADDALFFWNGLAGGEVGVVWRPKAFLPSKFSILNCQDRLPCSGGGAVGNGGDAAGYTLPNVSALLKRMIAIGDGLIVDAIIN